MTLSPNTFARMSLACFTSPVPAEWVLRTIPWWGIVILFGALAWHASRSWKLPLIVVISLILIGSLGKGMAGEMIDKYGYATYGGNSHFFADAHEGWVLIDFAGGKGLWVAERVTFKLDFG